MTLSAADRARLADIVALQPTKNATLQERWDMESGSEVHQYLESTLSDYYYRDENSLIRATDAAAELVDVEPGVEEDTDGDALVLRIPELEQRVLDVLPEPEGETMSVVAVLQAVRAAHDVDPDVDEVRSALQALRRKGAVSVTYRLVPTYGLAMPRDRLQVEPASTPA